MTKQVDPLIATAHGYVLAEGPFWDPVRQKLLWVDIERGLAISGTLDSGGQVTDVTSTSFDKTVGAVACSTDGRWLIAGAESLLVRDVDGHVSGGPRIVEPGSGRRLNDAKPDPAGCLVVGTLALEGGSTSEELFIVRDDAIVRLDDDLTLSNGLGWTADGRVFYNVDTERQLVYRRAWQAGVGQAGPRDQFLRLDDGYPDGVCVDAEDHLWVALWGLGEVRRYSPTAELVTSIRVPAPHTSSVAFAGPDLDVLVITTARQDLTPEELAADPGSGHLFTVRPGVRGLPQQLWNGRLPERG